MLDQALLPTGKNEHILGEATPLLSFLSPLSVEVRKKREEYVPLTGPDKSIVRLPGTSKNFCWASKIFSYLPRKMYKIYRET